MMSQARWQGDVAEHTIVPLVIFLFFARGFSTVLIETLVPRLRSLFDLSYAEVMLTQLYFFLGFFIFSIPAAIILRRVGYIRAIMLGLAVMTAGCLVISPAALLSLYPGFLGALFVMAAGIAILQVVSNPLIVALGSPKSCHSRLTLAQAFNSLGTTIGPLVGAWFILSPAKPSFVRGTANAKDAIRVAEAYALQLPFLAIAGILAAVAMIFWLYRKHPAPKISAFGTNVVTGLSLLRNHRFVLGTISIFVYVGAEVSIGSIMINYLMQDSVLSITAPRASEFVSLYWGSAMCGRFIGSAVLRIVQPGLALSFCSALATLLAVISSNTTGLTAAVAIIAIGLCNSIMFPTIFMMALEDLGDARPEGSGILCMAIVGGAVVPVITGFVADGHGLALALLVPAACYVWIAIYGVLIRHYPSHSIDAI